ncbi:hypothetical protein COT99_03945 [Candidatus Falkowbacteria bacterium CG10_big_fil_rev_8_21_14_0_10_43_10]|uniref:Uncharacterized protein n=1 Tax=Candidatus Falkowbacteria bacterium CG10_big_fil_rev_8_21_14_0_10_43_10 TaxID=1974567 RepID=A0A2H0V3E1_9BACT|nr:MAG: hypothetical protein COT99_03945 [Candidatus Falkowbacteria bacterium CG10_big_fil_rev_8_21_14_0_10_43_10]
MSEEINFLPAEAQPKKKKSRDKEEKATEFSQPAPAGGQAETSGSADKKTKGGFGKLFDLLKKENNGQADSSVDLNIKGKQADINKSREDLLREIKNKGEKLMNPEKEAKKKKNKESKEKNPLKEKLNLAAAYSEKKFFLFSGFRDWLKKRKTAKEKRRQERLILRQAKKGEEEKKKELKKQKRLLKKIQKKQTAPKLPENNNRPLNNLPPVPAKAEPPFNRRRFNILGTNLIKGQEFQFFNWSRAVRINIISILVSLLIIGGVWGYLNWLSRQDSGISENDRKILAKEKELQDLKKEVEKFNRLKDKVREAKDLFNKHIYWTNFFSYLENSTLPGVYYESFSGDLTGKYILPVIAKDFKTFITQLQAFQEDKNYIVSAGTEEVEIKEEKNRTGNVTGESASFEMNFGINQEIFYKQ